MGQYDLLRKSAECVPADLTPSAIDIVPGATWHKISVSIGTICAALAILLSLGHVANHALHCYVVTEQRYLMRLQLVLPAFAVIYTIANFYYPSLQYLQTTPEIVEAFAFVSLYQLYVEQAAGSADVAEQERFFAALPRYKRKRLAAVVQRQEETQLRHGHGSLRWFRVTNMALYQFVVVKVLWTPVYIVLTAVFCPTAKSGKAVHFLNSWVNFCTTTTAVLGMLLFYWRLRPLLKPHHAFRKALVMKKVIGVILLQPFIISIVQFFNGIHPIPTMTYGDFTVGIPAFMTQVEMFLFAIGFMFCYPVKEYSDIQRRHAATATAAADPSVSPSTDADADPTAQPVVGRIAKVSPLAAIGAMLNISDLVRGIWRAFLHFFQLGSKTYVPEQPLTKTVSP